MEVAANATSALLTKLCFENGLAPVTLPGAGAAAARRSSGAPAPRDATATEHGHRAGAPPRAGACQTLRQRYYAPRSWARPCPVAVHPAPQRDGCLAPPASSRASRIGRPSSTPSRAEAEVGELERRVDHTKGGLEGGERPAAQRLVSRVRRIGDVDRVK